MPSNSVATLNPFFRFFFISLLFITFGSTVVDATGGTLGGFGQIPLVMDDINLPYGSVQFSETDVQLPGKVSNLDLEIGRSYDSYRYTSDPTANVLFGRLWGGWMGHGWSLNLAKRAFLVTSIRQEGPVDAKIIIDSGTESEIYLLDTVKNKFTARTEGNLNIALKDSSGSQITIINTNGTRFIFSQPFYSETHKVSDPNSTTIALAVKGFYLTQIQDINGNSIDIGYESFGSTDIASTTTFTQATSIQFGTGQSLTTIIGSIYSDLDAYIAPYRSGQKSLSSYVLSTQIKCIRPQKVRDTFGRVVSFAYGGT